MPQRLVPGALQRPHELSRPLELQEGPGAVYRLVRRAHAGVCPQGQQLVGNGIRTCAVAGRDLGAGGKRERRVERLRVARASCYFDGARGICQRSFELPARELDLAEDVVARAGHVVPARSLELAQELRRRRDGLVPAAAPMAVHYQLTALPRDEGRGPDVLREP